MRRTGTNAVPCRTGLGRGNDARVSGEAEVVIASEVKRFASIDSRTRALTGFDDTALAPKTARRTLIERTVKLRSQWRHPLSRRSVGADLPRHRRSASTGRWQRALRRQCALRLWLELR